MDKVELFCLIMALMLLIVGLIFLVNYEKTNIKAPCVDGDGDTNLEGIMCDKEIESFFGLSEENSIILLFLVFGILMSIIFVGGFSIILNG